MASDTAASGSAADSKATAAAANGAGVADGSAGSAGGGGGGGGAASDVLSPASAAVAAGPFGSGPNGTPTLSSPTGGVDRDASGASNLGGAGGDGPVIETDRNCYCRTPFEWFVKTPVRQLVFFTIMQIFIYYDRGMIAGFLPVMSKDLGNIDNSKAGLLGSCFIIGYMVACPVFAIFSKKATPYLLMVVGMGVWVGGTIVCGATSNYYVVLSGRILTGVGEASFAGLAPTCIDDIAPLKNRGLWIGIFFCAMPAGAALGYIAGGLFATWHWQIGFISEGIIMVPFVVITYFIPTIGREPDADEPVAAPGTGERDSLIARDAADSAAANGNGHARDVTVGVRPNAARDGAATNGTVANTTAAGGAGGAAHGAGGAAGAAHGATGAGGHADPPPREMSRFFLDLYDLITNWVWVLITLGYAAMTFVIGALTFWAPQDFSITLHIKLQTATTAIGGITFACGVLGTFLGGLILDKMGGGTGLRGVARAMQMSAFCAFISVFCAIIAVETDRLALALSMLAIADLFLFATGAPVPSAILAVVPHSLRSLAMSMSIFFMHLLGDMPSPFLLGFLTDKIHDVRLAMLILVLWLLWTVGFWTASWLVARMFARKEEAEEARHES